MLFQLAGVGHTDTVGALAAPFGTPMISSFDGASAYRLAKFSGFDTACNWKSLAQLAGKGIAQRLVVYFDSITSGGKVDFTIVTDRGRNTSVTMTISETDINSKLFEVGMKFNNDFRVEAAFTNGSTTNNVKINKAVVYGVIEDES